MILLFIIDSLWDRAAKCRYSAHASELGATAQSLVRREPALAKPFVPSVGACNRKMCMMAIWYIHNIFKLHYRRCGNGWKLVSASEGRGGAPAPTPQFVVFAVCVVFESAGPPQIASCACFMSLGMGGCVAAIVQVVYFHWLDVNEKKTGCQEAGTAKANKHPFARSRRRFCVSGVCFICVLERSVFSVRALLCTGAASTA